jgi:hypothetical protein
MARWMKSESSKVRTTIKIFIETIMSHERDESLSKAVRMQAVAINCAKEKNSRRAYSTLRFVATPSLHRIRVLRGTCVRPLANDPWRANNEKLAAFD